jgi:KDO2-lipid IV(A) lauroyltransferase
MIHFSNSGTLIISKLFYFLLFTVSLLPMRVLYMISGGIYVIGYRVFGYREKVAIQNLSRSFPEMNYQEIQGVCQRFYRSFADYFVEILKTLSMHPSKASEKLVVENSQLIDKLISQNKNIIVCLGHCGNWEMLNFMPQLLPYDVYAVYKPLRNKIAGYLMVRLRSRFGVKLIPAKLITKHLLYKTHDSALYLFLADQCPKIVNEQNQFTFLNQQTGVFTGVEKLACATGSAVVYLNIIQTSRGHYRATCIPVCQEPEKGVETEITKKYIRLLEENIREAPSGWLWSHKRWKR